MAGDSHTGFNAGAFTVGAVGGAATIAGALGAGWANYRAAQQDRWAGWAIDELRTALDCSETMRFGLVDDLRDANRRIAELERAAADRAFIIKRAAARSLQAE